MAQPAVEEILIQGEESHASDVVEQRKNVTVLGSTPADLATYPPMGNPPANQDCPLVLREILVEPVQAARTGVPAERRGCRRPPLSNKASRASFTASPTATNGMRPPHRVLQINSHERPAATSSRTCQTMMRVPLKVGLPRQIAGSATMCELSSTRTARLTVERFLPLFMLTKYGP